jgi:hypothetical protein
MEEFLTDLCAIILILHKYNTVIPNLGYMYSQGYEPGL